ncbi:TPA: hypothetical protein ACGOVI_001371 [Streptococcus suis]
MNTTKTIAVLNKTVQHQGIIASEKVDTHPFAYDLVFDENGYRDDLNYFYYYYPIKGKAKENGITESVIQDFVSTLMMESGNRASVEEIYSSVVVPFKNDTLGIMEKVLVSQEMDYQVVGRAFVDHTSMVNSNPFIQLKAKTFYGLIPCEFGNLAGPYIPGRGLKGGVA